MAWAAVAWAASAFVTSFFSVVAVTFIASAVMSFGFFVVFFGGFFVVLFVVLFVSFTVMFLVVFFSAAFSDDNTSNRRGDSCGGANTLFVGAFGDFEDIAKRGSRVGIHSGFNVLHPFVHVILYV